MRIGQLIKRDPEVLIVNRLFIRFAPVVSFPAVDPLRYSVPDIFRVRHDFDRATLFEPLETFDGGSQLHAVIGSVRTTAVDLAVKLAESKNASPASTARITLAGAIRYQPYLLQATSTQSAGFNSPAKKRSTISRMLPTLV